MNNLFKATSQPINSTDIVPNDNINLTRSLPPKSPINKNQKKKLDFKTMKKNTISSLNEVEYFLNNINQISRYIKLISFFKH